MGQTSRILTQLAWGVLMLSLVVVGLLEKSDWDVAMWMVVTGMLAEVVLQVAAGKEGRKLEFRVRAGRQTHSAWSMRRADALCLRKRHSLVQRQGIQAEAGARARGQGPAGPPVSGDSNVVYRGALHAQQV